MLYGASNTEIDVKHPNIHIYRGVQAYSQEWHTRYQQADIFVLPTHYEAFGLVFAEAMAASLPVIATKINAIPEIVLENQTGFLITPGDQRSLATGLKTLIDDPAKRLAMGCLGRQRVEHKFDAQKNFKQLECIFREAAFLS